MQIEGGNYIFYEGNKIGTINFIYDYIQTLNDASKWFWSDESDETWYLAHWAIKNDKIYLIYFEGHIKDAETVDIEYLFPNQTEVFAFWVTDVMYVPKRFVKNAPLPKSKENVMDLRLEFKNGILIKREFIEGPLLINLGGYFKEEADDENLN